MQNLKTEVVDSSVPLIPQSAHSHTHSSNPIDHSASPSSSVPIRRDRASCLIIYTGGTIGMVRSSSGSLAPTSGYLQSTLNKMPELIHEDVPTYDILEWEHPIDSSDMTPSLWAKLAKQIEENYYDYDGFVILHGTDTMAYTASALSFMLENLNKTVILTGSMIPLSAPVSDAKRNLIVSLMCAVNLDVPEVCIFFNNALLRGNRCKKTDPDGVRAFESPNYPALAEMGVGITIRRDLILAAPRRRFQVHTDLYPNIAVIVIVPGFDTSIIRSFVVNAAQSLDTMPPAIVMQLYGAGNAPINQKEFISALSFAISKGAIIVATSQCLRGSVDMSQYATGSALLSLGVIDGRDMTVEACCSKLAYLMGRGLRAASLKVAMEENLRGELTLKQSVRYASNENNVRHGKWKLEAVAESKEKEKPKEEVSNQPPFKSSL
jgi:L-asparaginase